MATTTTMKYDIMASMKPSNQYEYINFGDGIMGAGIPYGISFTICNNKHI